ncbi:hypothetical protein [Bibersteinia trehalosi]|nr:hypothetical protein [Bibersteinia trehalosi]
MAQFNQNDFETTLLNRTELEQALGIKINLNNNATFFDDYAMYSEINLHDAVCIFLDMHPENWNAHEHPRYNTIFNAIKQSAETGKITARIEQDKNGFNQIFLTHDTIRQYAQTYNLQWNVPPYRAVEINTQTADNSELVQQLTAKDEEIARLKAEIEILQQEQAQSIQLSPVEEEPQGRISKAQRSLFSLLLNKLYPDGKIPNVNSVKDAINEELNKIGLSEVSYNTIAGLMKKPK